MNICIDWLYNYDLYEFVSLLSQQYWHQLELFEETLSWRRLLQRQRCGELSVPRPVKNKLKSDYICGDLVW